MSGGLDATDNDDAACSLYHISVRIMPGCIRLEITKPYHEQGGWLALLDAFADRWGDYGTVGGRQVLWAEVEVRRRG
jgi:hypothetical protein